MGQINVLGTLEMKKVSCICVTRNRARLLKKSIQCFINQSYSNKELVIVYYSDDNDTKELAMNNSKENVFFHEYDVSEGLTLGALRNKCVELTTGDYICVWDDDDWYSPNRIIKQYCHLMTGDHSACFLKQLVIYDYETDEMSLTVHRVEGWEGSMMCEKDPVLKYGYGDKNKHEDTDLLLQLSENDLINSISDPMMYVYFFHSQNTSSREHLEAIKEHSEDLEPAQESLLRGYIKSYIEDYKLIKDA